MWTARNDCAASCVTKEIWEVVMMWLQEKKTRSGTSVSCRLTSDHDTIQASLPSHPFLWFSLIDDKATKMKLRLCHCGLRTSPSWSVALTFATALNWQFWHLLLKELCCGSWAVDTIHLTVGFHPTSSIHWNDRHGEVWSSRNKPLTLISYQYLQTDNNVGFESRPHLRRLIQNEILKPKI